MDPEDSSLNQDDAIETYLKVHKDNPNDVEALVELGSISASLGRIKEARVFFNRALALEPWNEKAKKGAKDLPSPTPGLAIDRVLQTVKAALSGNNPQNEISALESNDALNPKTNPSPYFHHARPDIQRMIKPTSRRILDIGCGAGMLGYDLKQNLHAEVWGVEYIPEVATLASGRLDRVIPGKIEDALEHLPDAYFDTIICADLLEHLVNPGQLLTDLKGKLTRSGEVVASIPNVRHWSIVKGLLEGRWEYTEAGILDRTHLRFFTRRECLRLFEGAGYELVRGEAIVMEGDQPAPSEVCISLAKAGLDVASLAEESLHYQYLIVATPLPNSARLNSTNSHGNNDNSKSECSVSAQQTLTSIIILTWNQLQFTQACLESIAANTPEPHELILVDNGSSDGTVQWLRKQAASDSRITLIENKTNLGFAGGCNQGIKAANGQYIMLLNNDTVVTPGWLSGLRDVLERYPDSGIVGPMTNSASGIQVVPGIGYGSLEDLPRWASEFRKKHRYHIVPQRRIVGFCMLFRKELAQEIGDLDETFGAGNYEDDDFCLRAELAGYRNLVAGDVFIHHEGGATFAGNRLNRGGENRKNRELFKQKWDPTRLDESVLRRWLVLNAVEEAEKTAQQSDVDGAVSILLNRGIKADSADPLPYIVLTKILLAAGRFDDTLQVVSEMPPETDQGTVREIEAICYAAIGDEASAAKAAEQAVMPGKPHPRAQVVLGTLAARRKEMAIAERLFRQATEVDPSCGSAWLSLGMLLLSDGKQDAAWDAIRTAAMVDPLKLETMSIFIDMAIKLARQNDAAELVAEACRTYPDCRNLAFVEAKLLSGYGSPVIAMEACEAFMVRFVADDEVLNLALRLRGELGPYDRLVVEKAASVSLCMIVKDEQTCLARCLASVKPVVDEIVIVDTGSSDRTADIARAFGARVIEFPWNGNFSDARNHGIDQARGEWILVLDADEVLSKVDYERFSSLVSSSSATKEAWSVTTRNYTRRVNAQGWSANNGEYPDEEAADGWQPSWKVRLFPNDKRFRFRGEVHEMVEASLRETGITISKAPFVVHHYGELEQDPAQLADKRRRYFEIGKKKLEATPDDLSALAELAVQAGELGDFEDAVNFWNRLLMLQPDNVEALFNKGYNLIMMKRFAEALEVSRRAIELDPYHKEAAFNYGTCELYAGEPGRAMEKLQTVAARNFDYPLLQALMTVLYFACGKPDEGERLARSLREQGYDIDSYSRERIAALQSLGRNEIVDRLVMLS